MTNVRASNLHPTFLLRDILPFLGPSCFNVGRRFSFVPVNITSSPRRRHRQPSFALTALLSSPKPPSTGRNRTLMSWLSRKRVEPSSRHFGKLPLFLSCGNIPAVDIRLGSVSTRTIGMTFVELERELVIRRFFLVCRLIVVLCKTVLLSQEPCV